MKYSLLVMLRCESQGRPARECARGWQLGLTGTQSSSVVWATAWQTVLMRACARACVCTCWMVGRSVDFSWDGLSLCVLTVPHVHTHTITTSLLLSQSYGYLLNEGTPRAGDWRCGWNWEVSHEFVLYSPQPPCSPTHAYKCPYSVCVALSPAACVCLTT